MRAIEFFKKLLSYFITIEKRNFNQIDTKESQPNLTSKNLTEKEKQDFIKIRKGLRKFYYGDNFVWARDKKNADRKAVNAGYIG